MGMYPRWLHISSRMAVVGLIFTIRLPLTTGILPLGDRLPSRRLDGTAVVVTGLDVHSQLREVCLLLS